MSNLTPVDSLVEITGGDGLAGNIPAVPSAKVQCDIMVGDMRELVRQANAAAKLPLKYLNLANRIINKVSNDTLALTDAALGDLEDLVNLPLSYLNDPDLSLANSASAISSMLNCAYAIGDPDLIENLRDAKAMMDKSRYLFRQMSKLFRKTVGKKIAAGAHALVDEVIRKNAIGKLNSISRSYKDMLKTTGIKDALSKMNAIVTCAAGGCSTIFPLADQADSLYDKLGLDGNGDPLDIFTNSSEITNSKKYIVSKTSTKIDTLRSDIDKFLDL